MATIDLKFNTNAGQTTSDMKGLGTSITAVGSAATAAFKAGAIALGAFTAAGIVAIAAFRGQELSEIRLQAATENSGLSWDDNKEKLLAYSSSLQDISRVGDETSNDLQAFFLTATGSIELAQKATKATITESERLGKSLETIRDQIGNALGGQSSRIARQNKALQGMNKEFFTSGKFLEVINRGSEEFLKRGRALDPVGNIMGRIGDAMEPIGEILLNVLNPAFEELEGLIKAATGEIDGSEGLEQGIRSATVGMLEFGLAGLTALQPVSNLVFTIADGLNKISNFQNRIGAGTLAFSRAKQGGATDAEAVVARDAAEAEVTSAGVRREEALEAGQNATANAIETLNTILSRMQTTIERGDSNVAKIAVTAQKGELNQKSNSQGSGL